jgi:hypothetical protein
MRIIGAEWVGQPHIRFDPHMTPQYRIRRGAFHDGTMVFSVELLARALSTLFNESSYYIPMGEPPEGMRSEYTIGPIKQFSAYGRVKLPAGVFPGEHERVVIPVRCEYVPITTKDPK